MKLAIKFGGSAIADKKRDIINRDVIESLTDDLISFYKMFNPQLVLVTGGGYAHNLVNQYRKGTLKDYGKIHDYVEKLRNTAMSPLIESGLVIDVYRTFEIYDHKKHKGLKKYLDDLWQSTIGRRTFEQNHVWNSYGDIAKTPAEKEPFRIISGDDLIIYMARKIKADRIVFVIDKEGIYKDQDDPHSLITKMHANQISEIKFDRIGDQTGGLEKKVEKSKEALKEGIKVYFVNKDNFHDALYGKEVPTLLLP